MLINDIQIQKVLFQWSLQESINEVNSNCIKLRSVEGVVARSLSAYIVGLDQIQRKQLVRYSVSNAFGWHREPEGAQLHERARLHILEAAQKCSFRESVISRQALRKKVKEVLTEALGVKPKKWSASEIAFRTVLDRYSILTIVDFGGRSQLRYEHKILDVEEIVVEFFDLQAWMGFGHTSWDEITNVNNASEVLKSLVLSFLTVAPGLLGKIRER